VIVLAWAAVLQSEPVTATSQTQLDSSAVQAGRLHRGWMLVFAAVMTARMLGFALLPMLLVQAPALLVGLSPTLAHLVLTAPLLPAWLYFTIALATSIVQNGLAYGFGLALGQRATMWLEGQGAATHGATTRVLRWMQLAAPVVLIAMAGPPIAALAGVAKVRWGVFVVAMVAAQLLWVGACWWFGAAVTEQIETIRSFVAAYLIELSLLALALVGGRALWRRHKRRRAVAQRLGG
jgi:membrane protein DedA with SNARE-associated domain